MTPPLKSRPYRTALTWQALATVAIAAVAGLSVGGHAALSAYFTGLVARRNWWKIFVLLLAFGVTVEFLQHSMNLGRHGDVRDVLANSAGDLLGLALGWLGLSNWPQWIGRLVGARKAT